MPQQIYQHCFKSDIINEERKRCVEGSFDCKEQLIIDSIICEQARKENRNVYTSFINYNKVCDVLTTQNSGIIQTCS